MNNGKRLFSEAGAMGQKYKPETVTIGYLRLLYLSIENNQLLAKESIFYDQVSMTASQV
ncbi:MAG TPA: hypothetical protein VF326_04340 [Anaerolineaceae bacterium]